MSEVYWARDPRPNRDVALKVLLERFAEDAEGMKRFEQEAEFASALNNPNILGSETATKLNGLALQSSL